MKDMVDVVSLSAKNGLTTSGCLFIIWVNDLKEKLLIELTMTISIVLKTVVGLLH